MARLGRLIVIAALGIAVVAGFFLDNILTAFPPYVFFIERNYCQSGYHLGSFIIPSILAGRIRHLRLPVSRRPLQEQARSHNPRLSILRRHASYVAKDLLDLQRSGGGFGKVLFSFLIH